MACGQHGIARSGAARPVLACWYGLDLWPTRLQSVSGRLVPETMVCECTGDQPGRTQNLET
jgi:hypothetical protein